MSVDPNSLIPGPPPSTPRVRVVCRGCRAVVWSQEISTKDPGLCRKCAGELPPPRRQSVPQTGASVMVARPSPERHQEMTRVDWGKLVPEER